MLGFITILFVVIFLVGTILFAAFALKSVAGIVLAGMIILWFIKRLKKILKD